MSLNNQKAWAIVLAAGNGSRLAGATHGLPKQFLRWKGFPLYWHSALAFSASSCIEGLVFVFPPRLLEEEKERILKLNSFNDLGIPYRLAAGGPARRDSARLGLMAVPPHCKKILVHDAARPFLDAALVRLVFETVSEEKPCVVPALPVTDTIKLVGEDGGGGIVSTLPRKQLFAAQTPQGFAADKLRTAHARALAENTEATDDAVLMEKMGFPACICTGDPANIKITNPEDLALLAEKTCPVPLVGFGYDVHRYGPGHVLKLGGVILGGDFEVIAHSDGDVLLHALMDAICGAASLGDIGELFPDNDPSLAGISSAILLDQTMELARRRSIRIQNVDLVIVAQKPRIEPYKQEIRRNVASLLQVPAEMVNVKATSEEGMGFTGQLLGIKCYATVCATRDIIAPALL